MAQATVLRDVPGGAATVQAIKVMTPFIPVVQMATLIEYLQGEEGAYFAELLREWADKIATVPQTYDQDGMGLESVAHLHYFSGGCDWHITEIDSDPDAAGQVQAYGQADLGWAPELGYISIAELVAHRPRRLGAVVEFDLHWKPKTLAQVRAAKS